MENTYIPNQGRVIFLDIDGVLNTEDSFDPIAGSSQISRDFTHRLNDLLLRTNAVLVISSSWRYLITNGAMTTKGFEYLLRTHGVIEGVQVAGCTAVDEIYQTRGEQIYQWLKESRECGRYVVIDNNEFDMAKHSLFLVKTDAAIGLTDLDVDHASDLLLKGPSACTEWLFKT